MDELSQSTHNRRSHRSYSDTPFQLDSSEYCVTHVARKEWQPMPAAPAHFNGTLMLIA
jgi:hypothetical protein